MRSANLMLLEEPGELRLKLLRRLHQIQRDFLLGASNGFRFFTSSCNGDDPIARLLNSQQPTVNTKYRPQLLCQQSFGNSRSVVVRDRLSFRPQKAFSTEASGR